MMTDKIPYITHSGIEYRAALPYCYYDKNRHKLVRRVISAYTIDDIKLLYGDLDEWDTPDGQSYAWHFEEVTLYRQYSSPYRTVWKVEIDVPQRKRFILFLMVC
jgi:hypothetical protein